MKTDSGKLDAAPLVCVCLLAIALSVWETSAQITTPYPLHMWEGGMLADSYRSFRGQAVYEDAGQGHATHMYGPLSTWISGWAFRLTGPSFLPARILSLASAMAAIAVLLYVCRPKGGGLIVLVAAALLLGFGRTLRGYVEPRPDAASLLFGLLAVVMLHLGYERQRFGWHLGGLAALVIAFFFKQPSAMVCAVGVVAVVLQRGRGLNWRRGAMLVSPFVTMTAVLAALAIWQPTLFHYMVTTPAQYEIATSEVWRWLVRLPLAMPLLWVALALWLRDRGAAAAFDPKLAWITAALLVAAPCGIIAAAKTGGMANSLVPAYFAATALMLYCGKSLEDALRSDGDASRDGPRKLLACAAAALLLASVLEPRLDSVRPEIAFGDDRYADVVKLVRAADGDVVCPQDPSIAAMARGRLGRCLVFEYDHAGWPKALPPYFFDELSRCRYAVTIGKPGGWRTWPLTYAQQQDVMQRHGYESVPSPVLQGSVYTLWKRRGT